jgi:hypothetical protein
VGTLSGPRLRGSPAAPCVSVVVRIERLRGRRRYLLHDLRSGERHCFVIAAQLHRWLRAADRGGLR